MSKFDLLLRPVEYAPVQEAKDAVIEAAREWVNNTDRDERHLLNELSRAVQSLEEAEAEFKALAGTLF